MRNLAALPRKRRIFHLDDVRSIGLILHAVSEEEKMTVDHFVHHMNARGCMVRKIEMLANDENNIDKNGLPKAGFLQFFSSYHYDLLIDTTPNEDLFGLYATLTTKADLKCAYQDTTADFSTISTAAYDFIIRGEGPCTIENLLTEILSYLVQIRKQ